MTPPPGGTIVVAKGLVRLAQTPQRHTDLETTAPRSRASKRKICSMWMALVVRFLNALVKISKAGLCGDVVQPTGPSLPPEPGSPPRLPPLPGTNLCHFHPNVQFKIPDMGQFTKVRGLAKCIYGKVQLYIWLGQDCVIKDMASSNVDSCKGLPRNDLEARIQGEKKAGEDALAEIGVYLKLQASSEQCPYVLKMLAVFRVPGPERERIWLVLENCEGDFFDFVNKKRREQGFLHEDSIRSYLWQLLKAVKHMHDHNIGHRDISLENILMKDGQVRLMDFGQAVQLRSLDGGDLPYYTMPGKDYFRGPECYLPLDNSSMTGKLGIDLLVPGDCIPGHIMQVNVDGFLCNVRFPLDAVPGKESKAELCGYTVAPLDVFSCGVIFLILVEPRRPWNQATLGDRNFRFVHKSGVKAILDHWRETRTEKEESGRRQAEPLSVAGTSLLEGMLESNPTFRWSVKQCLESWFLEGPIVDGAVLE